MYVCASQGLPVAAGQKWIVSVFCRERARPSASWEAERLAEDEEAERFTEEKTTNYVDTTLTRPAKMSC